MNRQSKIYLHKLNLEFSASRGEINYYRAYFRTGAAPALSTVPSNHGLFTLSLLILSGDISLNPGPLRYSCEICGQAVRKTWRVIMCKECSVCFYQACLYVKDFNFKTLEKHPSYVRSCCNCGLTSFSSSMFSSGIVTSNRFDTLSDFPSSSTWNPTGTQATSTYLSRLGFPPHLSSPSHQKTEQKKSDTMDNIKPISNFIPYESQKWCTVRKELFTVRKLHLISGTRFVDPKRQHELQNSYT